MEIRLFFLLAVSLLLASCNLVGDKTSKFVGTWEYHPNGSVCKDYLIIEKVGENFVVTDRNTCGDLFKGTASYVKDQDKLTINIGGQTLDALYDPQSHHIMCGQGEYQKVDNGVQTNK